MGKQAKKKRRRRNTKRRDAGLSIYRKEVDTMRDKKGNKFK